MQPTSPLPEPGQDALRHSQALSELIQREIIAASGWISFEHYMRLALYAPGLGYYSGGATKFGQAGDFVTAPEMSPLFGRVLAQQAAQILELTGSDAGDILEFGAGSGKLALDLLLELEKLGSLPNRYFILEVSGDLQQRQRELFERCAPKLSERVAWLERLPEKFEGLMLANEVLDAMPVHLVVWRGANLFERGVTFENNEFNWSERPLTHADGALFAAALELPVHPGSGTGSADEEYISEINLSARHFIHSLGNILQAGVILLIDYGFGEREYYHPQRNSGTLMCHYRHRVHDNPFYLPGLQDVTSHVDFSAIARVGLDSGLDLLGYATQAHFLINCGITELLGQTPVENVKDYLPLANQLQKLVSPAEMGELFKAVAFGKNIRESLIGFSQGDRRHML
ncbi:MAG TPA: SAM-dependent methyltransferase [Nitrosospira sp.]|nr:SAM-dependent methyltransferase [Nitrosospira sp.]